MPQHVIKTQRDFDVTLSTVSAIHVGCTVFPLLFTAFHLTFILLYEFHEAVAAGVIRHL